MSSSTDKTQLEELIKIAKEKQNKLTAGDGITIEDDTISSEGDDFYNGSNTVSTLNNLPVDKSLIIANLSDSCELSFSDESDDGHKFKIYCTNNGDDFIVISTNEIDTCNEFPFILPAGQKVVIHAYCSGDDIYLHVCDVLKLDKLEETNKTRLVAGDIVLYDPRSNTKRYVSYSSLINNVSTLNNYTPIGVIVIPPSHDVYGTEEGAMVSLVEMSYSTPDEGTISGQNMVWGQYQVDTSLTNLNTCVYTGKTNEPTQEASGVYAQPYMPSDDFSTSNPVCPTDPLAHYYYNSSSYYAAPSPYLSDGSRNPVYYQTTSPSTTYNCLSDFDGIGNTNVLLDLATSQPDWKTDSTISDSNGSGYSPAACCCWRYSTDGTSQGDWYLPAEGELGYMIVRRKTINNTISTLNNICGTIGLAVSSSNYHWSSSEYSSNYARYINYRGYVHYSNKGSTGRVRAFARV